jgi:hypothetical protein
MVRLASLAAAPRRSGTKIEFGGKLLVLAAAGGGAAPGTTTNAPGWLAGAMRAVAPSAPPSTETVPQKGRKWPT